MADAQRKTFMLYPHEITEDDRLHYQDVGRFAADEQWEQGWRGRWGGIIFTDGLGFMGCGRYDNGPALVKQKAFDARWRELWTALITADVT
jgi:hypothetical protein